MPTDRPPLPSPTALARYAELFNQSAPLRHLGATLSFPQADRARLELLLRPEHLGGLGSDAVNGAVMAGLFDLAIGCTPALIDPSRRTATVQLSMSFERAVRGRLLHAEGRIDRAGGTLIFASAEIRDEAGQVCARAQGVVRLSQQRWASGESPAID